MASSGAPLFRAVTKDAVPPADSKGTLTAFWNKKKEKVTDEVVDLVDDVPMEEAEPLGQNVEVTPEGPQQLVVATGEAAAAECTAEKLGDASVAPEAPEALEQPKDQNEKKRKRAAKTDAQIAALNALFDADPYPSTAAKKEFAASMGLELVEVNNWLENRRRKARAAGVLGRPRLVHVSELEDEVLGDDHHPVIVIEAPPLEELIEDAQREIAAKKLAKQASEDACALDAAAAPVAAGPAPNAATDEAHAPMATDEAPAAAQPETTAAAAPKAPKAAPPSLPSPDERAKLAESLANEASLLRTHGLAGPLTDLAAATPAPYSDAHLAALIAGQSLPLSALVTALFPLLTAPEGSAAALTAEGLRSRIVDLATRKSHDPADNPKGALLQDALEAGPPPPAPSMWQWELRDVKTLPKAQRSAATQIRKRATSVAQRLAAVVAAHQALTAFEMGTCTEAKAAKAVDALAKHKSYEQLEADAAAELAAAQAKQQAAATKGAVSSEEKQRAAAAKEAEKERLRLEKEAAKELARKAKEEEKAKAAAEKEAEKERKQQEREAERERKQKEAEAAKLIKKTGFKDAEKLNKTANKFMSFFKASAPGKASAPLASTSPAGREGPSPSDSPAAPPLSAFNRRFPKPPKDTLVPQPLHHCKDADIDAALTIDISPDQAVAEWQAFLARNAAARAAPARGIGLPPSWARRPGAVEAAIERLQQLKEAGVDPAAVRTWRRKFIWFEGDSKRPPYYGSWARPGPTVGPRRPYGQDATLDYEVMSDQEWEEEPEGSSLSGADSMSEGGAQEEEEVEDSFMVADGYLSEDEGVKLDDEMEADSGDAGDALATGAAAAAGVAAGGDWTAQERRCVALQVQMERARRHGKPLVIMRADCAAHVLDANASGWLQGEPDLLEALKMEVLLPGVSFEPPADPAAADAVADAAAPGTANRPSPGGEGAAAGGTIGRPKQERPDDLLPALAAYIQANPATAKPKMIEGFMMAHPDRKMAKKWVGDKISEMAERVGNKWQLRQQPAALPAAQAASAAAPGATVLLAEATPAPAAVQPSGPLDRMFKAQSAAMPTPAVPSALRALGPASLLKAPERLVTTTAAGEAQEPAAVPATAATSAALSVLEVPQGVTGTGDAFWLDVVRHIEADGEVDGAPTFGSVFNGAALARLLDALPAFVLSVLLAALGRALEARPAAAARICSYLCNVVQALAAREATGKEMTLSQQAWADRLAQPAAVSLGELFEEPELPSMLTRCIQRADSRADGMAILEVLAAADAGKAALDRAEEEGKAALRKALEASAGSEHAAAAGRVLNMLRNS